MKRLVLVLALAAAGWYAAQHLLFQPLSPPVLAYAEFNEILAGASAAGLDRAAALCAPGPCTSQVDARREGLEGRSGLGFQTTRSDREIDREAVGFGVDVVTTEVTLETTYDPQREPIESSDYELVFEEWSGDVLYLEIDEERGVHGGFGSHLFLHTVEMVETGDGWRVRSFSIEPG